MNLGARDKVKKALAFHHTRCHFLLTFLSQFSKRLAFYVEAPFFNWRCPKSWSQAAMAK